MCKRVALTAKNAGKTWAVSGRNKTKLAKVVAELGEWPNNGEAANLMAPTQPALIADLNDHKALVSAFSKATLVINCTGPYRFFGDQVVRACLEGFPF